MFLFLLHPPEARPQPRPKAESLLWIAAPSQMIPMSFGLRGLFHIFTRQVEGLFLGLGRLKVGDGTEAAPS